MFSVGASCPVSAHRRMSLSSAWLGSSSASAIRQFHFPNVSTVRRDYAWKDRTEYFGVDLKTDITVESEVVEPYSKIKGHLVIDTKFPIEHDGIIIQLEALCSLNYSTKHNERTAVHKGKGCILENTKVNTFGHLESPIKCEIIPTTPPEFGGHSINSGVWHYPFQLQIPCDPRLPAPFQNSHGTLDYRLVVYMISHSSATYVKLSEKSMKCEGHYNLYDIEEASKPIVIEQYYRKSYFSQKKLVKATFTVQSMGFLQDDDIPFSVLIKNPKCIPLHLSANLLQHVKYQANTNLASVVKIVTSVESQEKDECEEPKPETQWVGKLRVAGSQAPTYACNSVCMYSVNYVVEFQVKNLEEIIISGQANIILGTTRDPIRQAENLPEIQSELYRSGSESSLHSQRSIYSTPIAYSVPANLNLSIDEPDDDGNVTEEERASGQFHLHPVPQDEHERSAPQHQHQHYHATSSLEAETGASEETPPTPRSADSINSLLSTQTALALPPSYSQLSSRIPSTETLPPTYADLDLNVESSSSLMFGDAVDLEKRYPINLQTLNLDEEYQVTFYSV